ncbi:MAG TPA: NlpC/P60 family protein [Solirubrobacteraceae bacterium]|nr:NlpC/P60 family protein [Solirubrobacteraceae bacterium]
MPAPRSLRHALATAAVALLALAPAAHGAQAARVTLANWDKGDQRAVIQAGLLPDLEGSFAGDRPLAAGDLRGALQALSDRAGTTPAPAPASGHVSVAGFDRILVEQLGLADVAAAVQHEAWRAGLNPPARFGTEVLARYLGLRFNHPAGQDDLELYPWQPITRAEAAYSLARVLGFDGWQAQDARDAFASFQLPQYTAAQRTVLRIAVSKIGMPYIWGGTSDHPQWLFGHYVKGGYDCSGFAWRVYKVSGLPWGRRIGGRTAAQQAGEIPRSQRIRLSDVQPADLLFFGSARFWQKATERNVVHEGIALSPGWAIHSSAEGVYVLPLTSGWLRSGFTWARRVL